MCGVLVVVSHDRAFMVGRGNSAACGTGRTLQRRHQLPHGNSHFDAIARGAPL
jgi:hypothetical protein